MNTNILPIGKFSIDSAKFYIDKSIFQEVSIPENFTLTDSDTGDIIDDFKKNSLLIPYKKHKIYIGNVVKLIGNQRQQMQIDKVLIYFPSKISDDYFNGITKELVIEVIEYLSFKGYIKYNDINQVFKNIYLKDTDIKMDLKFNSRDREQIKQYNQSLKDRFNGDDNDCKIFDNKRNGFGIQCWDRSKASITKPFFKFYDKSKEIRKDPDFFNSLTIEIQKELEFNFIYRFEFTMKDNSFFKKYGLSNRLEDVYQVTQDKWKEIGICFIDYAFSNPIRKANTNKVKPKDALIINYIWVLYHQCNFTKGQIMAIHLTSARGKQDKYRKKVDFKRLWELAITPSEYTSELLKNLEIIEKWDRYFSDVFGRSIF